MIVPLSILFIGDCYQSKNSKFLFWNPPFPLQCKPFYLMYSKKQSKKLAVSNKGKINCFAFYML